MRITNNAIVGNMMKHLQDNMKNLDSLSQKLSSGKEFQFPSENPIGAASSMQYDSLISASEQYQKNLNQAHDWLESSEINLTDTGEILHRARELAVYGNTDSLTAEDRAKIAEEVKQLKEEYVNIANSKLGDRYLFSGQSTDIKPFKYDDSEGEYNYEGDVNDIVREINDNSKISVNLNGDKVFSEGIEVLDNLYQGLRNDDKDLLEKSIGRLEAESDKISKFRAEIGAKMNRLDLTKSRLEEEYINLRRLQSENEDTDIAETITELKMQESVYRASLATGARIIQPTLVDFLN